MATLKQRLHRKNSSGTYDTIHLETGADCITGTLAVSHGGTGVTANPSMLVNLASTAAASVFTASPRPGVTGTLPVNRGGTGKASWTANKLVYASASTTLNQLAFPTTAGSVLCQGTSGAPYWRTPAQLLSAIGALKLATGSYVGTGASGEDSPTVITFPGTPLVWGIPGYEYVNDPGSVRFPGDPQIIMGKVAKVNFYIGNSTRTCNVSWSGNTASLWATEPFVQMNEADCTYVWCCISK